MSDLERFFMMQLIEIDEQESFIERNKDLIGYGSFEEQLSQATPIMANEKSNKKTFWHRSRGFKNIRDDIESIIEDSKWTDYQWNGEDEIPVDVILESVAADKILKYLLRKHLI